MEECSFWEFCSLGLILSLKRLKMLCLSVLTFPKWSLCVVGPIISFIIPWWSFSLSVSQFDRKGKAEKKLGKSSPPPSELLQLSPLSPLSPPCHRRCSLLEEKLRHRCSLSNDLRLSSCLHRVCSLKEEKLRKWDRCSSRFWFTSSNCQLSSFHRICSENWSKSIANHEAHNPVPC